MNPTVSLILNLAAPLTLLAIRPLLKRLGIKFGPEEDFNGISASVISVSSRQTRRTSITLSNSNVTALVISREGWTLKLLKMLRLVTEPQTGIAEIDRRYFFAADSKEIIANAVSKPEFRTSLQTIFETGEVLRLHVVNGKLGVVLSSDRPNREQIVALVYALDVMSKILPPATPGPTLSDRLDATALIMPCMFFYCLGSLFFYTYDPTPRAIGSMPWMLGFKVTLGLQAILALVLIKVFGRSPWAPRAWINGFLAPIILTLILGQSMAYQLNQGLDFNPAWTLDSEVYRVDTNINSETGKADPESTLVLLDATYPTVKVLTSVAQSVKPGDAVRLTLKPGSLGYAWLQGIELVSVPK